MATKIKRQSGTSGRPPATEIRASFAIDFSRQMLVRIIACDPGWDQGRVVEPVWCSTRTSALRGACERLCTQGRAYYAGSLGPEQLRGREGKARLAMADGVVEQLFPELGGWKPAA